jgi:hypothetical protein
MGDRGYADRLRKEFDDVCHGYPRKGGRGALSLEELLKALDRRLQGRLPADGSHLVSPEVFDADLVAPYWILGSCAFYLRKLEELGEADDDRVESFRRASETLDRLYRTHEGRFRADVQRWIDEAAEAYRTRMEEFARSRGDDGFEGHFPWEFAAVVMGSREFEEYALHAMERLGHGYDVRNARDIYASLDRKHADLVREGMRLYARTAWRSVPPADLFPPEFWWRKEAYDAYRARRDDPK